MGHPAVPPATRPRATPGGGQPPRPCVDAPRPQVGPLTQAPNQSEILRRGAHLTLLPLQQEDPSPPLRFHGRQSDPHDATPNHDDIVTTAFEHLLRHITKSYDKGY